MRVKSDRTAVRLIERRRRRTTALADAIRLQLEACRRSEGVAAIVVSDELGFCVAHSGCDDEHLELAARLPVLARPLSETDTAEANELAPPMAEPMVVKTYFIAGSTLHVGAVGAPASPAVFERVASGLERLLAQ